MNTRKIVMSSVVAFAVLVAMLVAVPSALAAYPANSSYFEPEDSSGAYCQNNTIVQVRINTSVSSLGGMLDIYFDPNCVNVTASECLGSPWSDKCDFAHYGSYIRVSSFNWPGGSTFSGDNLFTNITLHCINSSCNCTSSLNFSAVGIADANSQPITMTTHNGTINCTGPQPINVDIHAEGINGDVINATNYAVSPGTVTEDGITMNNWTAMGAMVAYCQDNGINVWITSGSWGNYTVQIGNDAANNNSWMYAVDGISPWVSGDKYDLSGGEYVHWYNYLLTHNLTVTSAGCCPINVTYGWGLTDTVPAGQTRVYGTGYYYDAALEALVSGDCSFKKWVYDGIEDTVNKSITVPMDGDKTATAYCSGATVSVDPQNTTVLPQGQFDVNITLDASGGVFGVQYMLTYDTRILKAESQVTRDFFVNDSIVVINEIDNKKGTVTYAATLTGNNSCEYTAGTIATIQFTAIGEPNATSDLTLSNVKVIDCTKEEVVPNIENGRAHIYSNLRPNIECVISTHEKNNAAKKFACDALLCVNVTNPQEEMGWNISYVRWSFGDGQYGTSEGGLPCDPTAGVCCNCKNHSYISWIYNASGSVMPRPDHNGNPHVVRYDPFNASVTVTDDGNPALSHTAFFDVWVFMAGDANGDAKVNILDAVWIGKHFNEQCNGGATCCDYKWSSNQPSGADLNNDCTINILDAVIVGTMWGHTAY